MNRRKILGAIAFTPFLPYIARALTFVEPSNPTTSAINAAIQSLGSGGGLVRLPSASFTIDHPTVTIPSGVTVRGNGDASLFVMPALSGLPLFQIAHQAVGAKLQNIYIDMAGFYHPVGMAIDMKATRRTTIRDVIIMRVGKYGIVANGDIQTEISNCYIARETPLNADHNQSITFSDNLGLPLSVRISGCRSVNTGMLLTLADSIIDNNYVNRSGYGSNMAFGENGARNLVQGNTLTNGFGVDGGGYTVNGLENWSTMTFFRGNVTSFNDGVGFSQGGWGCHIEGHEALGNGAILPQGTGIAFVSAGSSTSAETWVNGVRTLNVNGKQHLPKYEFPSVAGLIRYGTNHWQ